MKMAPLPAIVVRRQPHRIAFPSVGSDPPMSRSQSELWADPNAVALVATARVQVNAIVARPPVDRLPE
jgi:hypothetical protein